MNTKGTPPPSPPGGVAHRFPAGRSANPGGKPSIAKDCERASLLLTPDERKRLGLKEGEALSAAWLRANWVRRIALVAIAEPRAGNDTNWRYASTELGNRLYGKPKETVEMTLEGNLSSTGRLDLESLPLDERRRLLAAAERMGALAAPADDDKPTEH